MSSRKHIAGAVALAAALSSGLAQARDNIDVQWSVTIGGPIYAQPYPVYSEPYPIYSQPYPIYSQPYPIYSQPPRAYPRPVPAYPQWSYGPQHRWQPTPWDRDGDGIPNRYDRVYNPRWGHAGDAYPDRIDRRDHHVRNDRDGDGHSRWHDRQDDRRPGGR